MESSTNRSGKRAVEAVKWVLFWLLIVILVFQIVIIFLIPREGSPENKLPVMIYEVTSDSMYPRLRTGDGVVDVYKSYDRLKRGDMITFVESGEIITHEIIDIDRDGTVHTSGINPVMQDAPVSEDDYMGKVIIKLPGLSGFLNMTKGPVRKLIWILLIVFVFFAPGAIFRFTEKIRISRLNNKIR